MRFFFGKHWYFGSEFDQFGHMSYEKLQMEFEMDLYLNSVQLYQWVILIC